MKKRITIRVDEDVLDWFKSQGKGYQSKMNEALRSWMDGFVERGIYKPRNYTDAEVKQDSFFKPMPKGKKP